MRLDSQTLVLMTLLMTACASALPADRTRDARTGPGAADSTSQATPDAPASKPAPPVDRTDAAPPPRPPVEVSRDLETTPADSEPVSGLTPSIIARVLQRAAPRLRRCYGAAAGRNAPRGALGVSFIINFEGTVEHVELTKSLAASSAGMCSTAVLESLRFPAPAGGESVTVTYPFNQIAGPEP